MVLFRFVSASQLSAPLLAMAVLSSLGLFACQKSPDGPATSMTGAASPQQGGEVELAGVDTSALTPRERREWSSYVSEMLAPCADTPVSIAQCVRENRACGRCLPAAKYLVREVRDGRTREQAQDAYKARFDNERIKNIDVSDTPGKGPATAPITIVEWADFECPFCKRAAPILESMVDKFPGKVRFYFKAYPLSSHPHGESAARAAFAALEQNKFWEMHHKLFENSQALEQADLERYAKEIGLDVGKFKADLDAASVTGRISRDKKQADTAGLQGTPMVYINGREFESKGDFQADLEEWVKLEISLLGDSDAGKAAAKPAASAAPAASGQ